jgi:hypothetical protein
MVEQQQMSKEAFRDFAETEFERKRKGVHGGEFDSTPILNPDRKYAQITQHSDGGRIVFDYGCADNGILIKRYRMYHNIDRKEKPFVKDMSFIKDGKNYEYSINYDWENSQPTNAELKITSKVEWANFNPLTRISFRSGSKYPHYIYLQTSNGEVVKKHYREEQQKVSNDMTYDPPGIILNIEKDLSTASISIPSEVNPIGVMKKGEYFKSEKTENINYVFDVNDNDNIILIRLNHKTKQETILALPNLDLRHFELRMKSSMSDCAHIPNEYPIILSDVQY